MPARKRIPVELPSDELLLAAFERAERHRDPERGPGVLLATVKQHLGMVHHSGTTRALGPQLERLQADGLIRQFRQLGMVVWSLTAAGRERLDAARRAGEVGVLPESPQHRRWRETKALAGERIGEFRDDLRQLLDEAAALLDAGDGTDADAWAALSRRLACACKRLESASYCLREWSEPDEAHPDIVAPQHVGRRDIPSDRSRGTISGG